MFQDYFQASNKASVLSGQLETPIAHNKRFMADQVFDESLRTIPSFTGLSTAHTEYPNQNCTPKAIMISGWFEFTVHLRSSTPMMAALMAALMHGCG